MDLTYIPRPPPKTGAERQRLYRERLRAKKEKNSFKPKPQTAAECPINYKNRPNLIIKSEQEEAPTLQQQRASVLSTSPSIYFSDKNQSEYGLKLEKHTDEGQLPSTSLPEIKLELQNRDGETCQRIIAGNEQGSQLHKSPPKTSAERQRKYREKRRQALGLLVLRGQPKTSAERQREFRKRKQQKDGSLPKLKAKTAVERQRECRQRKLQKLRDLNDAIKNLLETRKQPENPTQSSIEFRDQDFKSEINLPPTLDMPFCFDSSSFNNEDRQNLSELNINQGTPFLINALSNNQQDLKMLSIETITNLTNRLDNFTNFKNNKLEIKRNKFNELQKIKKQKLELEISQFKFLHKEFQFQL